MIFFTDLKSWILGVWASPGGRETLPNAGGRSPPPFWKVSRLAGAVKTPKIDDFRSVKKSYFNNPGAQWLRVISDTVGSARRAPST